MLDFKTCDCILFSSCHRFSYPEIGRWKKADSLFVYNKNTIYFTLAENGIVRIEGYKFSESEVCGEVKFYNKNAELIKIEVWEDYFLQHGDYWASWTDGAEWAKQKIYKKGLLTMEVTRSIIYDDKKGFARSTETIRYKKDKAAKRKVKFQYF
jgi:hypothetical protein